MKNKLINSASFRSAYEKFYKEMRNYLWDLNTLNILADIEVATYQSFIDVAELEVKLRKLQQIIRPIMEDDEYLEDAFNAFNELAEDAKDAKLYCKLYQVEEV